MTVRSSTPTPSAADRAFARFAASGDPDDLALVFDATAARLVLVAAHLTGDRHGAEDLVQTTFLEAIRSAERFEAGRRVLPWLLTILTRRAANERRRRGRVEQRGAEAAVEELGSGDAEPLDRLAEREAVERIAEAIESLAKPYREVLALRHVHGLSAVEIARALDRPLGTVHAQLHRGVERLRGVLPAGFAAAFCALLDSPSLAACRARVISVAVAERVLPPVALTIGGIVVSKVVLAALAFAVLAAAWWVTTLPVESPAEIAGLTDPMPPTSPEPPPANEPGGTRSATGSPKGPFLSDREAVVSPTVDAASEEIVMIGRVIAADGGAPLPGAEVALTFNTWSFGDDELPAGWADPEPQTSGPDGRFRIAYHQLAPVSAGISITLPGRAPVSTSVRDLPPGTVVDHGNVPLTRNIEVHLRIVDDDRGEPVAGYRVHLEGPRDWPRTESGLGPIASWSIVDTDLDGRVPPRLLLPGRWSLSDHPDNGYEVLEPRSVVLLESDGRREITFRVERPDLDETVSGVVTDERGEPLVAFELEGWNEPPSGHIKTRSHADGEFFFRGPDPEKGPLRIQLDRDRRDLELLAPLEPIELGTRGVQVVVRRIGPVQFRMSFVDEAGDPIEQFSYACIPVYEDRGGTRIQRRSSGGPGLKLRREAHYPGGVLQRDDLLPGPYLVFLRPEGSEIPRLFGHRIELEPGQPFDAQVIVSGIERWRVSVKDERGDPVVGSRVEMHQAVGRTGVDSTFHIFSPREAFEGRADGTSMVVRTAEGITDSRGELELRIPPCDSAIAARVTGDTHTPALFTVTDPNQRNLQITVRRAATIMGELTPLEIVQAWQPTAEQPYDILGYPVDLDRYRPRIRTVRRSSMSRRLRGPDGVSLGEDGRFELPQIPAGSWHLQMCVTIRTPRGLYTHNIPLGEVSHLVPGEVREFTADISASAPIRFRGRALLDGQPARGAVIQFNGADVCSGARTDDDGNFETSASVPGRYLPILSMEGEDAGLPAIPSADPVEARAGQVVDLTLSFTRRRLEFRITDADGDPVGERHVSLRFDAHPELDWSSSVASLGQTDQDGRVAFPTAPPFACEVLVWNEGIASGFHVTEEDGTPRCAVLGPLAPTEGAGTIIELRLPR